MPHARLLTGLLSLGLLWPMDSISHSLVALLLVAFWWYQKWRGAPALERA